MNFKLILPRFCFASFRRSLVEKLLNVVAKTPVWLPSLQTFYNKKHFSNEKQLAKEGKVKTLNQAVVHFFKRS